MEEGLSSDRPKLRFGGQMQYKEIFTLENLIRAYRKCFSKARKTPEVIRFKNHFMYRLTTIAHNFAKGILPEMIYYQFVITEPKLRIIDATTFELRVIQACYCEFYLYDKLSPYYIEQSSACQKGKGTFHAVNKVEQYMINRAKTNRTNFYVLKADIKGFFENIDKEVLKQMLTEVPVDEGLVLLFYFINSFKGKGLPLGNRSSQLSALFYLKDIDNLIASNPTFEYSRYADDFIIFCDSKELLIELLGQINAILNNKLHMRLNSKTSIFPVSNSLTYLGWKYFYGDNNRVIKTLGKERKIRARKKYKELILTKSKEGLTSWKSHICNYEWETTLSGRIKNGKINKCPACANIVRTKSYAEQYPELLNYYSPNNIKPLTELVTGQLYRKKYLWICDKHGEYEQYLSAQIRGLKTKYNGCPYCAGKKVKKEESFGFVHPELVKEFSPENKENIFEVSLNSDKEAIWQCECGNKWTATFRTRHQGFGKCRKCNPYSNYENMLADERPDLEAYYKD